MLIKEGKSQEIKNNLKNKYTIVLAHADWCGACEMMKPEVIKLEESREDVDAILIKIDDNQDFVTENKIAGTPVAFIYQDGKLKERVEGFLPKEELERKL